MLPEFDGHAIPACDILHDFLVEHGDDEEEGDAAEWPEWTDHDTIALGAPLMPQECWPDTPQATAWSAWLADRRQPD